MTEFSQRVAALTGLAAERIETLASGSLSEVLLLSWPDGRRSVAKSGPATAVEADMLRALASAPAPEVEVEQDGVLILEFVDNDAAFTDPAWAHTGARLRALHQHTGTAYGWPADYAFGKIRLVNRETSDWPAFWAEQRLVSTAAMLSSDWRRRVERLAARIGDVLPPVRRQRCSTATCGPATFSFATAGWPG